MTASSITRVTVGVDASPSSHNALRWASALATATDADLAIHHTWTTPLSMRFASAELVQPTENVLSQQGEGTIDKAVAEVGITTEHSRSVQKGDAGVELCRTSAADRVIVVGRTGQGRRHGLARAAEILLGSTARHCVHSADGPVVAVPHDASWPSGRPVRVVVGVDGSDASLNALEWAANALPADAEIHAVHVFYPWMDAAMAPVDPMNYEAALEQAGREVKDWVRQVTGDRASSVECTVKVGDARTHLTQSGFKPDCVVVGTRGLTGLSRFVVGSVADHVLRHATVPVVVVPPPDESDQTE